MQDESAVLPAATAAPQLPPPPQDVEMTEVPALTPVNAPPVITGTYTPTDSLVEDKL